MTGDGAIGIARASCINEPLDFLDKSEPSGGGTAVAEYAELSEREEMECRMLEGYVDNSTFTARDVDGSNIAGIESGTRGDMGGVWDCRWTSLIVVIACLYVCMRARQRLEKAWRAERTKTIRVCKENEALLAGVEDVVVDSDYK